MGTTRKDEMVVDFDKPVVSPEDISLILTYYPFGSVVECQNLGGIPNTTYRAVTERKVLAVRVYSHGQSSLEHIRLEMKVLQHLASLGFESPRVVPGTNGEILQRWRGYWVCASEFIKGSMADTVALTPELVGDVGRLVASYESAMSSFELDMVPEGETFYEKGAGVLTSLGAALTTRGWEMDVTHVIPQWERASQHLLRGASRLKSNVIHADIWPPNVVCNGDKVTGLIDFDDCCYGPTVIDLAIALMEFAMFRNVAMDEKLAVPLLAGYFGHGGKLSAFEGEVIVDAMEMTCAMWLSYNVLQAPAYEEAEIYLRRLELLHHHDTRTQMRDDIIGFIKTAGGMSLPS